MSHFMVRLGFLLMYSVWCCSSLAAHAQSSRAESLSQMDWPLQPGESVRDLAQLIYPKNQRMQQYFIAETIRLNAEYQPDLHPSTVFSQENIIQIPSIKSLSAKSLPARKR